MRKIGDIILINHITDVARTTMADQPLPVWGELVIVRDPSPGEKNCHTARLFHPLASGTWYIREHEIVSPDDITDEQWARLAAYRLLA